MLGDSHLSWPPPEEQGSFSLGSYLSTWHCFLKAISCLLPCLPIGHERRRSTPGTPELWGPGKSTAAIHTTTTKAEPLPSCNSLELCDPSSYAPTVQQAPPGSLVPLNALHRREQRTLGPALVPLLLKKKKKKGRKKGHSWRC